MNEYIHLAQAPVINYLVVISYAIWVDIVKILSILAHILLTKVLKTYQVLGS